MPVAFQKVLLCLLLLIWTITSRAQSPASKIDNLVPVSPTAFQFLKYTELPVNEYSGLPTIELPLHSVTVDGITIPLTLRYHAGGNRVSQEASWVGLGWDLTMGSIVQTIQDIDDLRPPQGRPTYKSIIPDYRNTALATAFPYRYNYPSLSDGFGWSNPYPIEPAQASHGYMVATDYFVPADGNFNTRQFDLFESDFVDSEPDVFRANFLNHSLTFIRDFQTGTFVALDQKGYRLTLAQDMWYITTPSGEIYEFSQKFVTNSFTYSSSSVLVFGNGGINSPLSPSSAIWMLTGIVTANKQRISLSYSSLESQYTFPNVSQKIELATSTGQGYAPSGEGFPGMRPTYPRPLKNTYSTTSLSREPFVWLQSIDFPDGSYVFETSPRIDVLSGRKLDKINVLSKINPSNNGLANRKEFIFNYLYSSATESGNNFNMPLSSVYPEAGERTKRLKLISIQELGSPSYKFSYNVTPLPAKNSCAVDYWGFHNGNWDNTTLVPNPAQFNLDWGSNADNHSANIDYAKAEMLEKITYPTGGSVEFEYELNEFNNSWVPDYNTSSNILSHGNGLRVRRIQHFKSDNTLAKSVRYEYASGKTLLPIARFRTFNTQSIDFRAGYSPTQGQFHDPGRPYETHSYLIREVNGNGYYSSSALGSSTGVGYGRVTKISECTDCSGNGRIVTYYQNVPDASSTSQNGGLSSRQLVISLPAYKTRGSIANGSVDSVIYYSLSSQRIRKVANMYRAVESKIYYGARIFGYGVMALGGAQFIPPQFKAQHLIGYYPLYNIQTLLISILTTDYSPQGAYTTAVYNTYDDYNQVATVDRKTQTALDVTHYSYPYTALTAASPQWQLELLNQNRLTEVLAVEKRVGNSSLSNGPMSGYYRTFQQQGNLILEASTTQHERINTTVSQSRQTFYDRYNSNGKLLQYHKKDAPYTAVLWGYNDNYIVAEVKNAQWDQVAYTNFEVGSPGGWSYGGADGNPNNHLQATAAASGQRGYRLDGSWGVGLGVTTPGKYILSFQASSQPIIYTSINGQVGYLVPSSHTVGPLVNGFRLYTFQVPITATTSLNIEAHGPTDPILIDNVRWHPAGAQMTTFTHEPLVGVSSQTGPDGRTIFYEYDALGRLLRVRDEQNRVLSENEYKYARQP